MAISNKNLIDTMIQGIQKKDPKLYEILRLMADDLGALLDDIRPLVVAARVQGEQLVPPSTPTDFVMSLSLIGVTLSWTMPESEIGKISSYEIRKGDDWATGERVTKTSAFNVFLNPLPSGKHNYMVKAINLSGIESLVHASATNFVNNPGILSVTSQCIDNNVLLSWTTPTSTFRVDHYHVTKDGNPYGDVSSTFISIFESSAGTYTYGISAVDIAGNVGPEAQVTVGVKQPPDYVLVSEQISAFGGTKNNCILEDGRLWAIIETAKTWETHFTSQGWDQISDQLDLGFDHYLEPGATSGYYEETFDFGAIFTNVIINLDWDFVDLSGNVVVAGQIEVSDDNATWSAPTAGVSLFASSCRYARVRLVFTGTGGDDIVIISNFRVMLDVKQETDSGSVNALAADASGTIVTFGKAFKDVNSITLTTQSIEPLYAVYDFVDAPNPTQFKVLVFDSSGNRINYLVSWKARGVV